MVVTRKLYTKKDYTKIIADKKNPELYAQIFQLGQKISNREHIHGIGLQVRRRIRVCGAEGFDGDEVGKRVSGNVHGYGIGYCMLGYLVPELLIRLKSAWDKESARRWMGGTARKLTDEVKEIFYVEILRSTLPFKFGRGAEGGGVLMERNVGKSRLYLY
ncbi:hypothetical protein P5V15_002706 [Pogonomyrmex californicus]